MEYAKMLLVQALLVGAAVAQLRPAAPGASGASARGFPQLQPFQPLQQQLQQHSNQFRASPPQQQQQFQQAAAAPAQQGAFRTQTQTQKSGAESFQYITTINNGQQQESSRTFGAPAAPAAHAAPAATPALRSFAEQQQQQQQLQQQQLQQQQLQQQQLQQQQRFAPAPAPAPVPSPAPAPAFAAPVEFANAVPAPVQQHDAQVFQRRPAPAAPTQSIATSTQDFQQQFQQPARAQPAAPAFQDDFSAQPQQPEIQQDFQEAPRPVAPQVTRGRGQQPRRTAQAALRSPAPSPVSTPIRVVADAALDQADAQEDESFREQAENAHYTFASSVDDKLTDNSQVRQETRDGLKLAGVYSYSDGYFRRTVHYEADENGYRVVKEDVEPIGDGPQLNPNGAAEVQAQISGQNFGYRITADDIREPKKEDRSQEALSPLQQRFRDDRV